jgi:ribosomal protein S18 acetylase RimI-like enzyme
MAAREAVIRGIVPADRAALEQVLRSDATFRADEVVVALELIDGSLAGDPDYLVLAADHDGIVGFVLFGPTPMTHATYDLYWLGVAAASRGRGIARQLVSAMESTIRDRGGRHVRVETSPSEAHVAARIMYERLGYPIAGELADFYAPGEGLLTYYKRL